MKVLEVKKGKLAVCIFSLFCLIILYFKLTTKTPTIKISDPIHSLQRMNQLLQQAINGEHNHREYLSFNDLVSFETIMKYKTHGHMIDLKYKREIDRYFNCGQQERRTARCDLQLNENFRRFIAEPHAQVGGGLEAESQILKNVRVCMGLEDCGAFLK